jgi:cell division septation protein DedD
LGKGFPAYVLNPESGAPAVFRVRVGKFKERAEAESMAARLQKEEQFKPWIVR